MILLLISSLLGARALRAAALAEPWSAAVSVWPPGSSVYAGESVLLRCAVQSNATAAWRFRWYAGEAGGALTPNPRHRVCGDSYSITAVARADAGTYGCEARRRGNSSGAGPLTSRPAALSVSERPPATLTLTPDTRLISRGSRFTLQCPSSPSSTGWRLKHLSPGSAGAAAVRREQCLPRGGAAAAAAAAAPARSDACAFVAASGNGGLYWCEGSGGRSNAVHLTVSDGGMILRTPSSPVFEGDTVVLSCQSSGGDREKSIFLKNREEILNATSAAELRIENVTLQHEGSYKCASQDGRTESPESWLAVRPGRGSFSSTNGTAASANAGSWRWILLTCGVILVALVPVTSWLVYRHRYRLLCTRSCWRLTAEDAPVVALPATKQDVTEVQWDLSWMEMSNLLDKHFYPGT